ncbi:MAG: AsmA-like C-terminal domain-containing protein [Aaplasma endosymbiont of Hyalomma asiaticum]
MNSVVWACIKLVFVGAILLLGGFLYYSVSTKDVLEFRSKLVNLYLEKKLSEFFTGAEVSMASVKLSWRREDENFFLSAKGLSITDNKMGIKVEAPEVSIYSKVGILFLWGDWGASRLEIPKMEVDFLDVPKESEAQVFPVTAAAVREKLLELIRFDVPVKIGELLIHHSEGERALVGSLSFGAEREYDGRVFSLEFISNESSVKIQLSEHYKGVLSVRAKYNNFNTKILRYLESFDGRISRYKNLTLSGTADLIFDANDTIEYGDVNLYNLRGVIPYGVDSQLTVQRFRARVRYSDGKLLVNNFHLLADDIALRVSASLDSSNDHLEVNMGGYEIDARKICTYWPDNTYKNVRDWYCSHVLSGFFREPQISYHGSINATDKIENYLVSSHLKDALVLIDDELGHVDITDGGLLLSKGDLIIRSGNYNYRGIQAKEGVAMIRNVSDSSTKLEVRGRATSDADVLYEAADVNALLGIGGKNIVGYASTRFAIEVYNIRNSDETQSKVSITSEIRGLNIDAILDSFDIRNTSLVVGFEDGNLNIDAKGIMNGQDMTFTAIRNHESNNDTKCSFVGYISGNDLQRFSAVGRSLVVDGNFKSRIAWVYNANTGIVGMEGKLDVHDLSVGGKEGYFNFGNKERNLFFVASIYPGGDVNVQSAHITGEDIDIKLNGKIGKEKATITVNKLELFKTRGAHALIEYLNDNLTVQIVGEFLDLSRANLGEFFKGESSIKKVRVSLQAATALMSNGVGLERLGFQLDSEAGDTNIEAEGYFVDDKTRVNISYGPMGLEVEAENAGKFFKAIDVLDTVDGGKLSIYMYPDRHESGTNGVFSLTRFSIVNAPILARILTLSSLKGISNALSGSGIHFSKLNVPFNYGDDTIKFGESWMEGAELGISLGGKIDLGTKNFDVRGQIVPAYAVNKMIWNTPLFGKLLTGGHSRGIVAIDYKVKGTSKIHDISVNLLSILTPNLLKRVLKALDYNVNQESKFSKELSYEDNAA